MAEKKRQTELKSDTSFIPSQPKLTRMPALNAAGYSALKEAQKLFEKKSIQTEFQKLANRKISLEKVILGFAKKASKSLDTIILEENRVTAQEIRMNEKYRTSLIARQKETKPRRERPGKKNEFLITGQVLHPTTGEPVPGIVVEAIDKDISKHDFLDVDTTDTGGRYEISFMEKDFKERGEKLPEIVLRVSIDRKTILYTAKDVIKVEPAKRKIVDISLPEDQVKAIEKVVLSRKRFDQRRLNNLNQLMFLERVEHTALQEMGLAFKDSLNKAIGFLEVRISDTGKKKAKNERKID